MPTPSCSDARAVFALRSGRVPKSVNDFSVLVPGCVEAGACSGNPPAMAFTCQSRVLDRIGTNSAGIAPNGLPMTASARLTIGFPAAASTTVRGSVTGKHLRRAVAADQQHSVRFLARTLHAR
ncbi:MAG: hypothetical protein AW07_01962 [Candidatus Accumulibacter sp. SK-11]|nr:MAG: hypothetical protein AW07_01962 [Candidatus Accumulibacter sp. SK-11]